ncbi:hypothetical protein [Pseudarthrobacter sulfonivorans]|uniref:hypothetical protein n=1 Tax=Pseudarthrobacter sulfonivorans TaxID=121292 RepID=UPI001CC2B8FB|nr:hypothetical protein [Pseudarthrobacter sulfonivorans]
MSELLGGSTGVPMPMISSIYARDPQDMRQRVAEHRARGYLGHSIKVGASLVDKRPGEYFIVDANGGFIPETALRMLRLLPPGFDFVLEAPCATWRETMSLRQRCP